MRDDAPVVHRDKRLSRGTTAMLGGAGLFTIALGILIAIANAGSSNPLPASALPFVVAALVALGLGFMVLGVMFGVGTSGASKKSSLSSSSNKIKRSHSRRASGITHTSSSGAVMAAASPPTGRSGDKSPRKKDCASCARELVA